MEATKQCIENQEPGFLNLLKEALKLPFKNTHFISLIFLTSLPLLFIMIFFEILLEKTFNESLKILTPPSYYYLRQNYTWWPIPYYLNDNTLTREFSQKLIFLPLIYLFSLLPVELITTFLTVDLASKIHKDDHDWSIISIITNKQRLKGSFVTSLYVLFLSTCFLLGFIWLMIGYNNFTTLILLVVLIPLFPKFLEINAVWNLSFVVSVLEEIHGIDAFSVSYYYFRKVNDNKRLGRNLTLVFLVWGVCLRIPCIFFDDGKIGVIGRTSLLWMGNLIKWVAFVLYYCHCKSKILGKKINIQPQEVDELTTIEVLGKKMDNEVEAKAEVEV